MQLSSINRINESEFKSLISIQIIIFLLIIEKKSK